MARKIQDFGEKIGGARKDLWKGRGLTVQDIVNFNIKELIDFVNKKNIWIEPKWKTLRSEGYELEALYVIKTVRDGLELKPSVSVVSMELLIKDKGEEMASAIIMQKFGLWIEAITLIRDRTMQVKTKGDCINLYTELKLLDRERVAKNENDNKKRVHMKISEDIRDRNLDNLFFESKVQNFPEEFRGALKGVRIGKTYSSNFVVCIGNKIIQKFETEQEAKEYCLDGRLTEYVDKKKNTRKESKVVKVVRPQLEHIERFGPDIRKNVNVTGEDILKTFKFRGGEFGNWNTDDDRQGCLNYVFDALSDLMFVLDTETDFISLGKKI